MEKKVPERKVKLKEDDMIYVYDKRINKCIKEDCEGNVKYGLVLRVSVTDEETLNCFECNKCHMKYTPYPNYVRISKPELLHIYNQDMVTARDLKRAEDARKQAAREQRKNGRKSYGRKPYGERKPYEERKTYGDRKPYEGRRPYEERKSYGERKPDGENRPYGERKNSGDKKTYGKKKNVYISNGNPNGRKPYKKPYHKPYDNRTERKD